LTSFFRKNIYITLEFLTASLFHSPLHTLYRTTSSECRVRATPPCVKRFWSTASPAFVVNQKWLRSLYKAQNKALALDDLFNAAIIVLVDSFMQWQETERTPDMDSGQAKPTPENQPYAAI
jgi:hypothetical protein